MQRTTPQVQKQVSVAPPAATYLRPRRLERRLREAGVLDVLDCLVAVHALVEGEQRGVAGRADGGAALAHTAQQPLLSQVLVHVRCVRDVTSKVTCSQGSRARARVYVCVCVCVRMRVNDCSKKAVLALLLNCSKLYGWVKRSRDAHETFTRYTQYASCAASPEELCIANNAPW